MACIDEARAQETREKVRAFRQYRDRLLTSLEPVLRRFVRTDRLPRPREVEDIVNHVRHPYIPGKKDFRRHFKHVVVRENFVDTRIEIRDYFKSIIGKIPCLFCFVGYICCCYCCIEDPLAHYSGAKCQICNCKCRCLPCWATFIRKLWTCCNCMFPCCHCCQPPIEHDYHIARQKKMKWPDFSATKRPSKVPSKVHMENEKESRKTKSKSKKKIAEQVNTFSRKKKYSKKKIAEKVN